MFPVPHAPRSIRLTPYKALLHAVRAYSRRQSRKTFGVYLTETHLPQQLAQSILEFTSNKWAVLAILNVLFLIRGLFLHSAAAIILVVPVVMLLVMAVAINPLHFGLIVTINWALASRRRPWRACR
jgi:C4-dicarboxylate transporter, DctM subunit